MAADAQNSFPSVNPSLHMQTCSETDTSLQQMLTILPQLRLSLPPSSGGPVPTAAASTSASCLTYF